MSNYRMNLCLDYCCFKPQNEVTSTDLWRSYVESATSNQIEGNFVILRYIEIYNQHWLTSKSRNLNPYDIKT